MRYASHMPRLVLASCSNPQLPRKEEQLFALSDALAKAGYELEAGPIREVAGNAKAPWRWDPQERAEIINRAFASDAVGVLDISGGDLAAEVLPYLDFGLIAKNPKLVVGYSDISAVLGALPFPSLLWSPFAGLKVGFGALDRALAGETVRPSLEGEVSLADQVWVGGNLRCFLKLAGTWFWPNLSGKVLLVEALGTDLPELASALAQHRLVGTFESVAGVVVGQLTEIDRLGQRAEALELIRQYSAGLPLAEATGLGHSADSQAATLGWSREVPGALA